MDFGFIDNYQPADVPPTPTATEAQTKGYQDLVAVAQSVPLLNWSYDDVHQPDTGEKMGIITQSLLKVPGLASMVGTDENGIQKYDSALLAGAALGLVAELARHVLNIKLREDYADDDSRNELPSENEAGNAGAGNTEPEPAEAVQ